MIVTAHFKTALLYISHKSLLKVLPFPPNTESLKKKNLVFPHTSILQLKRPSLKKIRAALYYDSIKDMQIHLNSMNWLYSPAGSQQGAINRVTLSDLHFKRLTEARSDGSTERLNTVSGYFSSTVRWNNSLNSASFFLSKEMFRSKA